MVRRWALEFSCLDLSPEHDGTLGESRGCTSGSSAQDTSQNTGPVSKDSRGDGLCVSSF